MLLYSPKAQGLTVIIEALLVEVEREAVRILTHHYDAVTLRNIYMRYITVSVRHHMNP